MVVLIWPLISLQGCDKLSRTSTVYGQVTEIGGDGVDSIDVVFVAYKNISGQKGLLRITTDKDGNYILMEERLIIVARQKLAERRNTILNCTSSLNLHLIS
jgi:hypothetical protein